MKKAASTKTQFSRTSGKRTSIGRSVHSRPRNKSAKRSYKKYRGQGHPS